MGDWPLLSLVTFLPLVGAAFILFIRGDAEVVARNSRSVALWTSLVTFVLSLLILGQFDRTQAGFQLVEKTPWLAGLNITYYMGVDGISLWFVILSTLLTVLVVIGSWHSVHSRVREYMIAFLVMDTLMVGVFCALDIVLFYVFFEAILIPMYLIIGIWGGPRRIYAAFKFFLYTLLGSVLFLIAILVIYFHTGTTEIPEITARLATSPIDLPLQKLLWVAMFASFAVKVPMWPFHTWLPDAHVEAPTAGSVVLASVMLKFGTYGLLRFALPLFPAALTTMAPILSVLAVTGIIYGSLCAFAQKDIKKLIAYSSVAHMGIVVLGLMMLNAKAINGAVMQMLAHGISTGGLFLCVGVIYERRHTRRIEEFGGLAAQMPWFNAAFLLFTLASVGLPGLCGFVGEFMILVGTMSMGGVRAGAGLPPVFDGARLYCVLAATGVILGAVYMLGMFQRVMFGPLSNPKNKHLPDLTVREGAVLLPMALAAFWLGMYPATFLSDIDPAVTRTIAAIKEKFAVEAPDAPKMMGQAPVGTNGTATAQALRPGAR